MRVVSGDAGDGGRGPSADVALCLSSSRQARERAVTLESAGRQFSAQTSQLSDKTRGIRHRWHEEVLATEDARLAGGGHFNRFQRKYSDFSERGMESSQIDEQSSFDRFGEGRYQAEM